MIKEKVRDYIYKAVHVDKDKIKDDTLIFKKGYLDSMGFILMIAFIEKEFSIKTDDEDLTEDHFESINTITDYINLKLKHTFCAG
jgi:acyl carrier protein